MGLMTGFAAVSGYAQMSNEVANPSLVKPATAPKLGKLGDPAPALTVQEWIKGKPVKIKPGTNFYAIVFCTLSRANEMALTNLSSLQQMYQDKGLITVAISDDPPDQLRDFVQSRGDEINFTVAADDLAGKTANNYERVFGRHMQVLAYVVGKDGTVLWFGHPLREGMGEVVDEIATGRYDMKETKKSMLSNQLMDAYLAMARQNDPRAPKVGLVMLRFHTNDAPALCDLAFKIATDPYIADRDQALAGRALDRAEQISTTNTADIAVDRSILLFQAGKHEEALALAKAALAIAKTDEDKGDVNACIRAMEARLAAEKTNQVSAVNTGLTNSPPAKP
jgi:hypothetical protein